MSRKKMEEIQRLSLDELRKRLVDEEENLANLRFQLATRQLDSPIRVRTVRRDIARIQTLIKEREMAEARAASASAPPGPATPASPTSGGALSDRAQSAVRGTAGPVTGTPPAQPPTSETKAS